MPAGYGDPMFDGVENRLAQAAFGIPAVRGVAFGEGFEAAALRGSQHNDAFFFDEAGAVRTRTNRHAGILGGITSGMPIEMRVAFKPTPSIGIEQDTVSLSRGEAQRLTVGGRHDPCVVPRAVPVVEAAMAFVLCDLLLGRGKDTWT
ncbi:MAG: chorismate synthase, partial [Clostridia bacterium]|nr:chorismate synthase [Clostridia bacterium]